jgi:hypothetical protein
MSPNVRGPWSESAISRWLRGWKSDLSRIPVWPDLVVYAAAIIGLFALVLWGIAASTQSATNETLIPLEWDSKPSDWDTFLDRPGLDRPGQQALSTLESNGPS